MRKVKTEHGVVPLAEEQFLSLQLVGKMLHGSSKRKLLLWITGPLLEYVRPNWPKAGFKPYPEYRGALESLNDARISLYALLTDHRPDSVTFPIQKNGTPIGPGGFAQSREEADRIALGTGGKWVGYISNFSTIVPDIAQHFDSYYAMSFSTEPVRKDEWIALTVKSINSELKVIAAEGFIVGK